MFSDLKLHCKRSNTVTYPWKNVANLTIDFPSYKEYGSLTSGDFQWIDEGFSAELAGLLTKEGNSEGDGIYGSDVESDADDDDNFWGWLNI